MIGSLLEHCHSLRFKIVAALFLILTASIGCAMLGIWTYEREQFIDMANDTAIRAGQVVAETLHQAMLENNRTAIQLEVNKISTIYDPPSRITIINPQGLVAVSSDPALIGKTLDRFKDPSCVICHNRRGSQPARDFALLEGKNGPLLRHAINIPNQAGCDKCHPANVNILGVLLYDADFTRTNSILHTVFIRMLLTGLVTFLIIGLVLFLAVDKFINKPTARLMQGFERVGQGNFNFWVEEESSNEFEYMAGQFNVMSRAIGRFINEIKEKNKESAILYAIVREVSETIEWEQLKSIILNLVHEIFKTEEGGLVMPHRLRENCFDIVLREAGEKRLKHLDYCLDAGKLSLPSLNDSELAEWHRNLYTTPRFLDNYQRLLIPLFYQNEPLGLITIKKFPGLRFSPHERAIAPALANHVSISLANAQLYHLAITDGLTGLYSKRHLFNKLEVRITRQRKHTDETFVVMMLDLDQFKGVNDTYGHETGDQVLIQLSELLRRNIRLDDTPFRYGGEEFVVILPTPPKQITLGLEIAERLRTAVEKHSFECPDGKLLKKTVSIGVAFFPMHGTTSHEILRAADMAMYQAKVTGRNRVCLATPPAES